MTIKTNRHHYPILNWVDLSPEEQSNFDYLNSEDRQAEAEFFRYRGNVYDLGEFIHPQSFNCETEFLKWDGYQSDSFFSGILIKFVDGFESVIVATYFS
jgi:hypothetical protein